MTAELIKEQIVVFVNNKLTEIIGTSTMGKLLKPVVVIYMKNNIDKIDSFLKILSDKDGNIEIINLIENYEESILNDTNISSFNVLGGSIDVGNGQLKLNIPYIEKNIIFGEDDIEEFKELLTTKKDKNVSKT